MSEQSERAHGVEIEVVRCPDRVAGHNAPSSCTADSIVRCPHCLRDIDNCDCCDADVCSDIEDK